MGIFLFNGVPLHEHLRDVAVVPVVYESLHQTLVVLFDGTFKRAVAFVDGTSWRIHVDYQSVKLFTHFQAPYYVVKA